MSEQGPSPGQVPVPAGAGAAVDRFPLYLAAGILCINLIAVAAALGFFYVSRGSEEQKFEIQSSTLARLITQDIEQQYALVALSLRVIAEEHAGQRARGADHFAAWIQSTRQRHPALNLLRITDAQGDNVFSSSEAERMQTNIADRDYFIRLRDDPRAGLQVTPPLTSRSTGKRVIVLARRLGEAGNGFSGITLAAIPVDHFAQQLARLDLGRTTGIGLFDPRHGWIARSPGLATTSDPQQLGERLREAITTSPGQGFFAIRSDGVERSAAYDHSRIFNFYLVVDRRRDDYMAHWAETVRAGSVALAAFALLTVAFALLLLRNWKQRSALTAGLLERDEWLGQAQQIGILGLFHIDVDAGRWTSTATFDQIIGIAPGYSRTADGWLAFVYPEDRARVGKAFIDAALAGQGVVENEYRIVRQSDRALRWVGMVARRVAMPAGEGRSISGVVQDVTARKRVEEALQQNERDLRAAFDQAAVGIAFVAPDGAWLNVNDRLCEIVGYTKSELRQLTFQDITHPDDLTTDVAQVERMLMREIERYSLEKRYLRKDGRSIWVHLSVSLISNDDGTPNHFVSIVEDIEARKSAERDLRQSRELMQKFLDHLPGFAYIKDDALRLLHANRRIGEFFELAPEELVGRRNSDMFAAEFAEKITADDRRVLASGRTEVIDEVFGGGIYQTTKFVIPQDNGVALLGGITLDVTRRRQLEQRVKALLEINEIGGTLPEKEFLTRGLELAESLSASAIGFLHFVNDDQETIELVTWTVGALKGCTAAFDQHYPISQAGIWADCFRAGGAVIFNDYAGHGAKHGLPDGHAPLSRLISVPVIEAGAVRMMIGVGNKASDYDEFDVTTAQLIGNDLWRIVRRLRVEEALSRRLAEVTQLKDKLEQAHLQLLQSEKMSAIGQLAAGIAHEINNPIGFVYSNLGTLGGYVDDLLAIDAAYRHLEPLLPAAGGALDEVRRLKAGCDHDYVVDDLPKLIHESKEGLERVRKIVLDLKDYARVGEVGWQWVDLQQGLDSTINIVANELKYKAEVERQYAGLPSIRCLPSQLNQVFMNLLVNAAQAIEGHGRIVIRTGSAADSVWVEIEDSGHGMSAEVQKRLFEPFFTTKPVGKGTGLGLSISYGIIEKHHGRIDVRSLTGCGTTFRITLPLDGSQSGVPR